MMYKVYEQEQLKLCAIVEEEGETKRKTLSLMVVEDGVGYTLRNVSAREVARGKGADYFGDVIPQLLFEKAEKEKQTTELQKINGRLMEILQKQEKTVNSGMTWNIREVHYEVCEYVKRNSRIDYFTIENGMCRIRGKELGYILEELGTEWSVSKFVKALKLQNMLHTDNGRLQKWVTDSSGTGTQYRAYVFDTEFKKLEVC